MRIYDLDLKKLAVQWLPTMLRTRLMVVYATTMQRGAVSVLQSLKTHRKECLYRLTHNGQVCYLRAVLNDRFDPIERRISINDVDAKTPATIYRRNNEQVFLVKRRPDCYLLPRRGFGGPAGYDFNVVVPFALVESEHNQLIALLNTYKLASKRYVLTTPPIKRVITLRRR